ncbi:MAG: hypothetical protein U0166_24820 [Acidobacteriota bacterium]
MREGADPIARGSGALALPLLRERALRGVPRSPVLALRRAVDRRRGHRRDRDREPDGPERRASVPEAAGDLDDARRAQHRERRHEGFRCRAMT